MSVPRDSGMLSKNKLDLDMFKFDKQKKIESMKPYVDKLIVYLQANGIDFYCNDSKNENIVLVRDDKVKKISHHYFYRFSGLSSFFNQKDDKTYEWMKISDDIYINTYMRSIIDIIFNLK